jgi:glycosyltransferase involved in cell wall biosynthesis
MAPPQHSTQRVALVHDFLLDVRGAERVFLAICDLYPDADIYTAVYDEAGTEERFARRNVHTSFLQRLRPSARTFRSLLPLYPSAIESFDLSGYDLVVSSSSAWAHAVICDAPTVHVSYCHNPFRYAWNDRERVLAERDPITRLALRAILRRWRQWDWIAAQRVDSYLANSRATQARIAAYWGRDSAVVHPPVETERFEPGPVSDHYLVLSELMSHKRIDVAVRAFNRLGLPLVVVGDGPDARRLQRMAGPTVRFTGRVSDREAARLLQASRALIVTAVEEFGIAAVEAQAAGRPVVAMNAGGVRESVLDGVTGCFFDGGVEDLVRAVRGFDDAAIDPRACTESAARFGTEAFRRVFPQHVDATVAAAAADGRLMHERREHERRPNPLRHGLARRRA